MKNALVSVIVATVCILSANVYAAIPGIDVSPDPLNFGNVRAKTSFAIKSVRIENTGYTPGYITTVATGDTTNFGIASDRCAGKLFGFGAICVVDVAFFPQSAKHFVTNLKLSLAGQGNPLNISIVEGNGIAPDATPVPTNISFGDQTVGKSSNEKTLLLENFGSAELNITDIVVSAPFSRTPSGSCGSTLGIMQTCTISTIFTPTTTGSATGTITITDDALDSPQIVTLSGTGVTGPQPHASLSRNTVDFGNQVIGTTSDAAIVTLKNTGTVNLNITSIAPTAEFNVTDDCGAILAQDTSCTLSITFSPTTDGAQAGTITIVDDASDSPQTIALDGKGTVHEGPKVELSTTSIDFGEIEEGTTSAPQSYTLTNIGDENLTIDDIEMVGDDGSHFTKESDCLATLAPGRMCQGDVTFTPQNQQVYTATVEFRDNTSDSPQKIALAGTGTFATFSGGGSCSLNTNNQAMSLAGMITITLVLAGIIIRRRL